MADKANVTEGEVHELTRQFYVTLRAYVARLSPEDEARSPKSFKQVEDLLNEPLAAWSNAYQIEQLIVDLFDEATLDVELKSRLLEATSSLRPALAAQYEKLAGGLKTPAEGRALLGRLVNDLQWRYTVNEVRRTYSKEISKVTGMIFIVAIAMFAASAVLSLRGLLPSMKGFSVPLLLAGSAGGWGAGFSMLASLRARLDAADLDDLKLMKSWWILWSRPLIGVGAAAILFFFMAAGLLEGPLFPKLSSADPAEVERSRALLIVWCFLAGFSERLVPALLAKTEERALSDPASESDRFKPSSDGTGETASAASKIAAKTDSGKADTPPTNGSITPASPGA